MQNSSIYKILQIVIFVTIFSCDLAQSQIMVKNIAVGAAPVGIGINQITNRLYVTNSGDNSVSIIDGENNKILDSIDVGNIPKGVAVNTITNHVYITNFGEDTVSVIDAATNEVIDVINVGIRPLGICVNELTNLIYLVNSAGNSVDIIDGDENIVLDRIDVNLVNKNDPLDEVFLNTNGIVVNPNTNIIYVTHSSLVFSATVSSDNNLLVIDGASNEIVDNINLGSIRGDIFVSQIYGLDLNRETNQIYVANETLILGPHTNRLQLIDGESNDIVADIVVPSTPFKVNEFKLDEPFRLAVNPNRNHIFITDPDNSGVIIINEETKQVKTKIEAEELPVGVAVNTNNNFVYVVNKGSNSVTVLLDEDAVVTNLIVIPSSHKRSLLRKKATVIVVDRQGNPLPGIKVDADTSGAGVLVWPSSAVTDINGTAKFFFRFKLVGSDGTIVFSADGIETIIKQD